MYFDLGLQYSYTPPQAEGKGATDLLSMVGNRNENHTEVFCRIAEMAEAERDSIFL